LFSYFFVLPEPFALIILQGSLAAQAELGDAPPVYGSEELNCLLALRLAPNVTTSLLERISELHISHHGLKSNIAELKYLETASKLSLYGQHQFHVKDAESTHIILSVYSGGITIFEKDIIINRFAWPAIIELSYKRSVFYIQVRAGSVENTNARIGFCVQPQEQPSDSGGLQWNIITFSEKNVPNRKRNRKI
jgi:erythrocyte membrane protein band 4.1